MPTEPTLIAKYEDGRGASAVAGKAPQLDFIKATRTKGIPQRQKVLKYELGDEEDKLEVLFKVFEDNGVIKVVHRWFRVLKETTGKKRNFLLVLELPQDRV